MHRISTGSAGPYANFQSAADWPASTLKYDADTVADALTRVCRPRPIYHASSRISSEHIHETILGLLWMMGARTSSVPESQSIPAELVAPSIDNIAVQDGSGLMSSLLALSTKYSVEPNATSSFSKIFT